MKSLLCHNQAATILANAMKSAGIGNPDIIQRTIKSFMEEQKKAFPDIPDGNERADEAVRLWSTMWRALGCEHDSVSIEAKIVCGEVEFIIRTGKRGVTTRPLCLQAGSAL